MTIKFKYTTIVVNNIVSVHLSFDSVNNKALFRLYK